MKIPRHRRPILTIAVLTSASSLSAATVTWTGAVNGTWDTGTGNWTGGSPTASQFVNGDAVVFDDTGANTSITLTAALTPGSVTVNNSTKNYTFAGSAINGSGSLLKQGTGTLTLASANGYTGGTTVSAGTLQLNAFNSAGTGTITLNDASTGSNNTTLNLSAGGVTYSNTINVANQGSGTTTIAYTGATSGATLKTTIALNKATTFTASNLTGFLQWGGTLTGSGDLTIGSTNGQRLILNDGTNHLNAAAYTGNLTIDNNALVEVRFAFQGLKNNVTVNSGGIMQVAFSNPTFNALNGDGGVVRANFSNTILTVGNGDGNGSFAGSLQDTGSYLLALVKTGSGTQTLSGASTATGGTTVNGGTLKIAGAGTLGVGALAIGSGATFDYSSSADQTISGVISGAGSLVKNTGAGTLTLSGGSGTSTLTGATTVNAGTLKIGGAGVLNSGSYAGSLTIGSGTTFAYSSSANQTLSGALTGSGTLVKDTSSASTLTLSGAANTGFTGAVNVNAGTLNLTGALGSTITVNSGGKLLGTGSTTGDLTLNSGSSIVGATGTAAGTDGTALSVNNINTSGGAGHIVLIGTVSNEGTIDIVRYTGSWNGMSSDFDLSGYRAGSTVSSVATGTVNVSKLQFQFSAATDTWTLGPGGTWDNTRTAVWNNDSDNKYYSGDSVYFADIPANATVNVTVGDVVTPGSITFDNTATNYTLSGSSINGIGVLTKKGAGTLTLASANGYTGGTTVSAGTLQLDNVGSAGSGAITLNDANTGSNDTTLNLNVNGGTLANAITVAAHGAGTTTIAYLGSASGLTLNTSTVALNGAATFTAPNIAAGGTNYLFWNTTLTGNGPLTIGPTNGQRLIMSGSAAGYTGDVTVSSGANIEVRNVFTASNNFTVNGTGKLTIFTANLSVNALNGDGTVLGNEYGNPSATRTLTLGQGGGSGNFSGSIQNTGNSTLVIVKTGTGTQTLSGANTYTGGTAVSAGTLALATGGRILVKAGDVTIASGATLAMGGGTLKLGVATATLANSGTLSGSGVLDLASLFDNYNDKASGAYQLITGSGTNTATFTVQGYDTGVWSSVIFNGGNLVFTAVPEPATYGLLGAGTLAGLAFVRRRRRAAVAGSCD